MKLMICIVFCEILVYVFMGNFYIGYVVIKVLYIGYVFM